MDTSFNISRLGKLITIEYYMNSKKILLTLGMLLGICVFYFGIAAVSRSHMDVQFTSTFFFLLLLVFQGYITNICFSEFSSKPKTISLLLVPASNLEKFMAKSVYCMLVFPLIFLLYYLFVMNMGAIYNSWITNTFHLNGSSLEGGLGIAQLYSSIMLIWWFFTAACFLCGAQFFKKRAHTKTFLVVIASFILIAVLVKPIYFLVSGNEGMGIPFLFLAEQIDNKFYSYSFVDEYRYIGHCLTLFVSLYLVVIAWVKFNEKTV